jgi:arabinan endo-1,5-alpha-L-arabinosidase
MRQTPYQNPLLPTDFPDPSIIDTGQGGYFAYATHDEFSPTLNNILISHSLDLVHWSEPTGALLRPPVWANQCQRFWCPQVVFVNGQYRLYYAAESDAKDGMHLALAISQTPPTLSI